MVGGYTEYPKGIRQDAAIVVCGEERFGRRYAEHEFGLNRLSKVCMVFKASPDGGGLEEDTQMELDQCGHPAADSVECYHKKRSCCADDIYCKRWRACWWKLCVDIMPNMRRVGKYWNISSRMC